MFWNIEALADSLRPNHDWPYFYLKAKFYIQFKHLMPDLIIHIGFPKCASTSLQKLVFKDEKGYLGAFRGSKYKPQYSRQFRACTAVGPRQWNSFLQARKWADRIRTDHSSEIKRFILSDEMLTNRNKFKQRPIIPFLNKFSNEIWTEGEVKVVVILRNHADRMASGYSQISDRNPSASQADFEKQLLMMQFPDYAKWVAELFETLGRNKVYVLLMEDIGNINFWNQLFEFCEIENSEPESMIDNFRNTKRTGHNSWNIQPFNPERKGRTTTVKIFDAVWPSHIFSDLRSVLFNFVGNNFERYYSRKHVEAREGREKEIRLEPQHRKIIQKRTHESTKRLSAYLKRDMHAIGY